MKGIVLAGGTGSRLFPLTKITNKHLLPIYNRPMIYYPIQTLVDAGIRDILIVTGGRNSGDFLRLLANGKEFGLKHINYTYQEGEGGIADALALAEHFADGHKICVVLGDNIIEGNIRHAAERFRKQEKGAHILLKEVPDAERFGVAEVAGERGSNHSKLSGRAISRRWASQQAHGNPLAVGLQLSDKRASGNFAAKADITQHGWRCCVLRDEPTAGRSCR